MKGYCLFFCGLEYWLALASASVVALVFTIFFLLLYFIQRANDQIIKELGE